MTPHFMPSGHCLSKMYLFADEVTEGSRGQWKSEKDVVISPNGLVCAMRDVGRGYAQAAVEVSNFCRETKTTAPWAAAYPVPEDYCLFSLPSGWTSLQFVSFPIGGSGVPWSWCFQTMTRNQGDEEGWAPSGVIHHDRREGTCYLPHGGELGARIQLPRALAQLGPDQLNAGVGWADLQEFVFAQRENEQYEARERWRV